MAYCVFVTGKGFIKDYGVDPDVKYTFDFQEAMRFDFASQASFAIKFNKIVNTTITIKD